MLDSWSHLQRIDGGTPATPVLSPLGYLPPPPPLPHTHLYIHFIYSQRVRAVSSHLRRRVLIVIREEGSLEEKAQMTPQKKKEGS